MRQIYYSKLVTYLLVATFIMASAGTVFGYAWCFGDDGHVEVSYSSGGVCCAEDLSSHAAGRSIVATISQLNTDSCGSCMDVSPQQRGAVFSKRLKRVASPSVATLTVNNVLPAKLQSAPWTAKLTTLTPRVSPAILAHRTVVLLN